MMTKETDGGTGSVMDSSMKLYLREIGGTPLLTMAEEIELARRISEGDEEARVIMIKANLRLVVKIARGYSRYGLSIEDLISEGNIGLMKAVERFDPTKGGRLSTYAAWWIKQRMKRALVNQSKTVRIPVHMVTKISKMRNLTTSLTESLGREPTDEELCEGSGMSRRKLMQLKRSAMRPLELDASVGDEDGGSYGDLVRDEEADDPFEVLSAQNLVDELDEMLEKLDEREGRIIEARFGLDGKEPLTLEEVGVELGLTRERIRQLQNEAIQKMKSSLQKREDPVDSWPATGRACFSVA